MKNRIKYLVLLILLILSFSCKQEVKNKNFIDKLSSIQNGLPSPYFNYYLYFKLDNGQILETNVDFLYEIYKIYYSKKYTDFGKYLENIITQKEIIRIQNIKILKQKGYSLLNLSDVDKNIEVMNIKEIEKNYLKAKDNSFMLIPNTLEPHQIRTILYKMFTEGYIINPSDFVGYYSIRKYDENDWKK